MKKIYVREDGTKRVVTVNEEASKTDQQWKENCDANHIIEKFHKTGQITHLAKKEGTYADVSHVQDLHSSLIQVEKARSEFYSLPAALRKRFNNSMLEYVKFIEDPKNDELAIELGLKVSPEITDNASGETLGQKAKPSAEKKPKAKKEVRNDEKNTKVDSTDN